jgi:hypothetical protein
MNQNNRSPTLHIDVYLATNKLFGNDCTWTCSACKEGMMRYRGEFYFGLAGIEGNLAMGIPPRISEKYDLDAWEGSRNSLEWDWWECLGIQTISPENGDLWESGFRIIFFFMRNTFFDSPLKLIKTITLTDSSQLNYAELSTNFWGLDDFNEDNFNVFKQLLESEFDAEFIKYEYINN